MNKKKPRRKCLNCGKECKRRADTYCDNKCQAELRTLNAIRSGKATTVTIRRYLLKTVGNKCQICGLTEWRGVPVPLVADHKDGNPNNNALSNIRLVCPNCDALLPTYKGRNKGKGRWSRKLRYQQGKSY